MVYQCGDAASLKYNEIAHDVVYSLRVEYE